VVMDCPAKLRLRLLREWRHGRRNSLRALA